MDFVRAREDSINGAGIVNHTAPWRQHAFHCIAAFLVLASLYHVAGSAGAPGADGASRARHLAFVAIDAAGAWYVLARPLPLLPVYLAVTMQQVAAHGTRAVRWWLDDARIDGISLITVAVVLLGAWLLVTDARDRSTRVRRLVCPWGTGSPTS